MIRQFRSSARNVAGAVHTWGVTSRSQEKSSIDGVTPSASGVSSSDAFDGWKRYSFFRTESEKYGFSLKYCVRP